MLPSYYHWHIAIGIEISFGGIPKSRSILFLQIFLKRAAKTSAGNTSAGFPWVKWPQTLLNLTWLCTKGSHTFSGTFSGTLLNLTWLCPEAPHTFSRTFSGTLLNLTWFCTKASHTLSGTFSGTFSGTLLNLTWLCTKASHTFSGTFFWTLLNLTWLCTKASRNLLWLCTQASQTFSGTFSGTLLNVTRLCTKASQEPFLEPSEPSPKLRWTWPGACTSAHRSYSGLKTPLAYAVGEKGSDWTYLPETTEISIPAIQHSFQCKLPLRRSRSRRPVTGASTSDEGNDKRFNEFQWCP